jgi:CMP/dCMP kinase
MIISICGTAGSGKSTVARILAQKLGYKHYYMGGIRRQVAKEKGMNLEEFNEFGEDDISTDKVVDDYQAQLGKAEDNFVIEGRTSFYFIPQSFKVFIDVDPKTGAERVFKDKHKESGAHRNEKIFETVEETMDDLKKRVESDKKRYTKYYNFDCYDLEHYDFIIDTSDHTVSQVVNAILEAFNKWKQ